MNKATKLIALSILMSALAGGAGAQAASLAADGVKGANDQLLTEVRTEAGEGGFGSLNGTKQTASFRSPESLAFLPNGTLLISDTQNHTIRKSYGGQVVNYAGIFYKRDERGFPVGALLDGGSDLSMFQRPQGIAIDSQGNVFVADSGNNAIRKIDPAGKVTTVAGNGLTGSDDGSGAAARFNSPADVAVAPDGTLYVADTLNHLIRSISPAGVVKTLNAPSTRVVEVTAGQAVPAGDYLDGLLASAKFNEPGGLALDAKGNLYVADTGNQRIRYIDFQTGNVTTVAGASPAAVKTELYAESDFADGAALEARFSFPLGLAVTDEGGLLIADSQNHSVRYLLDGKVTTIAGEAGQRSGNLDGTDRGATLERPVDVTVSPTGEILVADSYNNKIRSISLYRLPANLPKDGNVKVVLDLQWIEFDALPEIVDGRTMVPVRAITEALGYTVTFDDATRAVQLKKGTEAVELTIGKTGIKRLANGAVASEKATDVAPYIKADRTYVPVRFFAEEIGLDVQWNDANRTAILRERTIGGQ